MESEDPRREADPALEADEVALDAEVARLSAWPGAIENARDRHRTKPQGATRGKATQRKEGKEGIHDLLGRCEGRIATATVKRHWQAAYPKGVFLPWLASIAWPREKVTK